MATNYCSLAGTELTDTGRTISKGIDKRVVQIELANGQKVEYLKALKNTFDISWEWLPGATNLTTDGKAARDTLFNILNTHIQAMPFILHDQAGDNTYQVFLKDYKEDVQRRDYTLATTFYKVTLSLIEA